jgi:hypothetical protein
MVLLKIENKKKRPRLGEKRISKSRFIRISNAKTFG